MLSEQRIYSIYAPVLSSVCLCFSSYIPLHFSLSLSSSIFFSLSFCMHSVRSPYFLLPLSQFLYFSLSVDCSFSLHLYIRFHSLPWCICISHSQNLSLYLMPNINIPFLFSPCLYLSMPVSIPSQSLPCCISFSRCLSLFVSMDRLVSLRAALWHGEMELVCSCSDGSTLQSG